MMNTHNIYVRIGYKYYCTLIDNSTVQEVNTELNEILLDAAIRVKRKNGVKKIHK